MKALTISQPYASLIASGQKWIENRYWATSYRGPIAIHAGKGTQYLFKEELVKYPTGCVIATAKLTACVSLSEVIDFQASNNRHRIIAGTNRSWSEVARHEHIEGPYCWILEYVQKIDPAPARGKQGLWEWDGRTRSVV